LRILDEEARKEQEKKAKKKAAAEAKKLGDTERLVARAKHDPNQPFEGSLKLQKWDGLLDIAYAIGLKDMDKCVMADIRDTIIDYFDKHPHLRESPVYFPLFNPSHCGGAQVQQAAAIPTLLIPSTSQQRTDSLRQPLENSFLTNVTLSHPLSHIPYIPPPSYSHSQFNLLPPQPPLAPPPQFNLQHNNSTSTISPHLNSYYIQYPNLP